MGRLIMHEWASLLALVSGTYDVWAGMFAIAYRKFFWDMVGGTLGPAGIIPGPNSAFFIKVIVDFPVIPILNILFGLFTLALEWPIAPLKGTSLSRSFTFKAVFYVWCGFLCMLPYQTIDAGVFYAITALVYVRAIGLGEMMAEAKEHRGSAASAA